MEQNEENIGEVVLRKVRADGLVMSRVPKNTRDLFIKIAEEEFADDYGLLLKFLMDEFIRRSILESMDIKLNYIISLLENSKEDLKEEESSKSRKIRMIDGKEKIIEKEANQK